MKKTIAAFTAAAIAGVMMGTTTARSGAVVTGCEGHARTQIVKRIPPNMPGELRQRIRRYAAARKRREEDAIIELLEAAV